MRKGCFLRAAQVKDQMRVLSPREQREQAGGYPAHELVPLDTAPVGCNILAPGIQRRVSQCWRTKQLYRQSPNLRVIEAKALARMSRLCLEM